MAGPVPVYLSAPRPRLPRRWLAALVTVGLVSGVAGGTAVTWLGSDVPKHSFNPAAPVAADAVPLNRLTMAPLVERVAPAAVNIAVLRASPYAQNPLPGDPYYRLFLGVPDEALGARISAGSGFVVDAARGLVVTNHHVVENARAMAVGLGNRKVEAKLLGSDADVDIAVLRIPASGLKQLPLGDSDAARWRLCRCRWQPV
ncbi:MAG TPA: trypsin-like peptidase domain-containing protein [Sphingomicrobium sp.]